MIADDALDTLPWYRQFWPWVLISIPATTVVACMVMISLAVMSDDGLVSDNYYREGLAINDKLAPAKKGISLDD